jgi:hypothetical protein
MLAAWIVDGVDLEPRLPAIFLPCRIMDGYIRMSYYLHHREQFGGPHDCQRYPP